MMKEFERKMNKGMGRETDLQPRLNGTLGRKKNSVGDPDPDPYVLGLPDPDPLVRGTVPAPAPSLFS
jgi:hypothetical protein